MKRFKSSSLAGMFLLGLLVCLLAACTSQSTDTGGNIPPSSNGATPSPTTPLQNPGFPIKAIRMLNRSKGWALTDQNVLFTSDGGQNWKDVTPSVPTYGKYAYGDFMNDKYAWIVSTAQPIDNSITVVRTSDGGQNWQTSIIPINEGSVIDYPHFLTTQEGFLELGMFGGPGAGSEGVGIFHTTDGGQSWTEISDTKQTGGLPHGGLKTGISFKDVHNGWATGEDASMTPWLYATHDGGHTWSLQNLPLLGNSVGHYTTTPPVIFGNDAFLPVRIGVEINVNTSVNDLVIYKSTNGGASWSTYTIGKFDSNDLYIESIHNAWATDQSGNVYGTSDAGEHWSKLASTVDTIKALSFTDTTYGWAISGTKLWQTIDGGSHWSEITYHIVA